MALGVIRSMSGCQKHFEPEQPTEPAEDIGGEQGLS